jgi:hypothetical protein
MIGLSSSSCWTRSGLWTKRTLSTRSGRAEYALAQRGPSSGHSGHHENTDTPPLTEYGPYGAMDACLAPGRLAVGSRSRRSKGWAIRSPNASSIPTLAVEPSPLHSRS